MAHDHPRQRFAALALVAGLAAACGGGDPAPSGEAAPVDLTPPALEAEGAAAFAALALDCVTKEYPYGLRVRLESADDLGLPRDLTPVFYGCYDWHSAVHGHWLLARLTRRFPGAEFTAKARTALDHNLTAERVAAELDFVSKKGRRGFERPYGLAWAAPARRRAGRMGRRYGIVRRRPGSGRPLARDARAFGGQRRGAARGVPREAGTSRAGGRAQADGLFGGTDPRLGGFGGRPGDAGSPGGPGAGLVRRGP